MSGEMTTSTGNGFSNLLVLEYLFDKKGYEELEKVVEGDDGLFPLPPGLDITPEDFLRLGWMVKVETFESLSEASFCGLVFDEQDLAILTDPRKHMAEVGVCSMKYHKTRRMKKLELLRARGYAYVYQYAGCPILQDLGLAILRCTRGVSVEPILTSRLHSMDEYKTRLFKEALESGLPVKKIGQGSRMLMARKFGVSESDQHAVESYLQKFTDGKHLVPELEYPVSADFWPEGWAQFYEEYSAYHDEETGAHLHCWGMREFDPSDYSCVPVAR
jgi:hypothetical protein